MAAMLRRRHQRSDGGHHHETWEGSGYSRELMSDRLPIIGRIVAVAHDAITTDRAYRKALPSIIACGEVERRRGAGELIRVARPMPLISLANRRPWR
jgi:HD-GYP domain-containing protein (c-di-GMP phosphodiesterase class II)